jgi:ATP-dependent exoDNAse (exonuclease V) alpha subunit
MKIISRGKGKSAVAAAAYRSGDKLTNEYDGMQFSYSDKKRIVYTEILLPDNAPREYLDRSTLWNAVEKIEKAANAQLARDIEVSLPVELSREQNIKLIREYVQRSFVDAGMCADVCVHDKNNGNPHAHIMLTMRPFNEDGTWGTKQKKEYILDENGAKIYDKSKRQYACRSVPTTDWNERTKAEEWRAAWADIVNGYLEKNGHTERVDHRSYERQGIEQIPTIHLGVAVIQMEARGIVTDRGNINREIEITNTQIKQLRARVNRVKVWLDENKANTPPTLYDTLNAILNNEDKSKIANLKLAAKTLNFILDNHISDLPALADKVSEIQRDCTDAYERKKKIERRVKTLDKHIEQSENFKKYRSVNAQYEKLYSEYKTLSKQPGLFTKGKTQKALDTANDYRYAHSAELGMYDAAAKYLKDVLQKRFDSAKLPPIRKWRDERETCRQELGGISTEYSVYKRDVESAEAIKRFAVKLMIPDEPQEHQKFKSRGIEI